MSFAFAIRFWIREHSGWNRASEIEDGMQACGISTRKAIKTISNVVDAGLIMVAGSGRHIRCTNDQWGRDQMQQER